MSRTVDRLFINQRAAELGLSIEDRFTDEQLLKAIESKSKVAYKQLVDRINRSPFMKRQSLVRVSLYCNNPDRRERGTEELFASIDGQTIGQIMFYPRMEDSWTFKEPFLNFLLGMTFHAFEDTPMLDLNGRPVSGAYGKPRSLGLRYEFTARLLPQPTQEELDRIAKRQAAMDGVEQQNTMGF